MSRAKATPMPVGPCIDRTITKAGSFCRRNQECGAPNLDSCILAQLALSDERVPLHLRTKSDKQPHGLNWRNVKKTAA